MSHPNTLQYHLECISKITEAATPSLGRRYSLFPLRDEEAFKFYKKQEGSFWSANELEFDKDLNDFNALPQEEKEMLSLILAFFAVGDGLVSRNIALRFLLECTAYEETCFFTAQLFIELVHSETYSLIINTLIPSAKERDRLFNLVDSEVCVQDKANYMQKYIFADRPDAERQIAFCCSEGIFFSVMFLPIFHYRSLGLFVNLIFVNEQINKDEGLHLEFGAYRFGKLKDQWEKECRDQGKDPASIALSIVKEAVEIEEKFIHVLLKKPIRELNVDNMKMYLHFVGNRVLHMLGYPPHWKAEMPAEFTWMEEICLAPKSLIHEIRTGSYPSTVRKTIEADGKVMGKTGGKIEDVYNSTSMDF